MAFRIWWDWFGKNEIRASHLPVVIFRVYSIPPSVRTFPLQAIFHCSQEPSVACACTFIEHYLKEQSFCLSVGIINEVSKLPLLKWEKLLLQVRLLLKSLKMLKVTMSAYKSTNSLQLCLNDPEFQVWFLNGSTFLDESVCSTSFLWLKNTSNLCVYYGNLLSHSR